MQRDEQRRDAWRRFDRIRELRDTDAGTERVDRQRMTEAQSIEERGAGVQRPRRRHALRAERFGDGESRDQPVAIRFEARDVTRSVVSRQHVDEAVPETGGFQREALAANGARDGPLDEARECGRARDAFVEVATGVEGVVVHGGDSTKCPEGAVRGATTWGGSASPSIFSRASCRPVGKLWPP
jgi:hypothetical protein